MTLLRDIERIESNALETGRQAFAAGVSELRRTWLRYGVGGDRLKRLALRHQFQEYTDTTAAYEAGEDVVPGDCWRACLASLLEVPISDVPHFIDLYPITEDPNESDAVKAQREVYGPDWWRESVAWVQQQRPGWTIAAWDRPEPWVPLMPKVLEIDGVPLTAREIVTGPSPRGAWNHSVLVNAQTGELEHDPFPGGQGVLPGPGNRVALVREEWL